MGYSAPVDDDSRTPPAPGTWTALDAARVRAAEDRLRIETTTPSRWPVRRLGTALRRAAAGHRRPGPPPRPRTTAGGPLRFGISIAAPNDAMAARWGDWHLAAALAHALDDAGHLAVVRTREHAGTTTGDDVHLVVRGLEPVARSPDGAHVLWIISHPDRVTTAECDAADLVLVASRRFADHLRARTSSPVEVLLQATDHHRFRPLPPDRRHRHDVVVVAKTRDVARPIVLDAISAGLRPSIYGTGWEGLVDPSLVVRQYVPNRELPLVYNGAGVVLNDHWDDMRRWGFVSNRLFDVLACGVPVISDAMPEIDELFEGAVGTYRTTDELGDRVRTCLDDRAAARRAADAGRRLVLARHTMQRRATELLDLLARHGGGVRAG